MSEAKRGLRVSTTVVTTDGRSELKSNDQRIYRACSLIAQHVRQTDLFVLPAGFLRARSDGEVREVARPIVDAARRAGFAVVVGVDTGKKGTARAASLPHFLVGWAPGMKKALVWRQRSVTSADARQAPAAAVEERRALPVAGELVVPLACGEVFNPTIRAAVAKLRPRVAILAAHTAAGARHWAGQQSLARLGVPSVRAVHASGDARQVMATRSGVRHAEWRRWVDGISASCFTA